MIEVLQLQGDTRPGVYLLLTKYNKKWSGFYYNLFFRCKGWLNPESVKEFWLFSIQFMQWVHEGFWSVPLLRQTNASCSSEEVFDNRHVIKWADFSYCLAARQLPGRTASYESDRVNMITWISDVISIILYAGIRWSIGVFYAITAWDLQINQFVDLVWDKHSGNVPFWGFLYNGTI